MEGKGRKGALLLSGIILMGAICGCAEKQRECTFSFPQNITTKTQKTENSLEFPWVLQNSELVIEEVLPYQGPYWEDKTGEMVENVAAIMLYNPTDRMIAFGSVILKQAGETLCFFVHQMPPKSRCLIAENKRKGYSGAGITACYTGPVQWDYPDFSREQVDYLGFGPRLTIINRDGRWQDHIAVWYKKYDKQKDCYLGGAAYCEHFYSLPPEERITVKSKYYDAGDCRIVSIRLEE